MKTKGSADSKGTGYCYEMEETAWMVWPALYQLSAQMRHTEKELTLSSRRSIKFLLFTVI